MSMHDLLRTNAMSYWPIDSKSNRPQLPEETDTAQEPAQRIQRDEILLPDNRHTAREHQDSGHANSSGGKYKRWRD